MSEIAGKQPSAAAFHRKRAAAISNAIGAWARCERTACRRKGACKGAEEIVPLCLPLVIRDSMESVAECLAAVPGVAPRAPTEQQAFEQQIWNIARRAAGLTERHVDAMERRMAKKEQRL